jgi:AraC family transcriptional activator FtrA
MASLAASPAQGNAQGNAASGASPHPVALLVPPGVAPLDLTIPGQIFGDPRPEAGGGRYALVLCTERPGLVPMAGGLPIGVPHGLDALGSARTVIVPGVADPEAQRPTTAVLDVLRAAHAAGARLVSICTGAFALAEAGLLDGRRATTHWAHAARFAARFPRVRLDPRPLYVDEGDVLTSAGVTAGLDLCLHVVRRDFGAAVANAVARRLVAPPHRAGGQAQYAEMPVEASPAGGLSAVRAWALEHLGEPLTVDVLARRANASVRHFSRRFRAETGTTPLQWLVQQRVLLARGLLETTELSVAQIAARAGFGSPLSLRQHFERETLVTPAAYRRTFRGE